MQKTALVSFTHCTCKQTKWNHQTQYKIERLQLCKKCAKVSFFIHIEPISSCDSWTQPTAFLWRHKQELAFGTKPKRTITNWVSLSRKNTNNTNTQLGAKIIDL